MLKALGIIDPNLELRWMPEIPPSLMANSARGSVATSSICLDVDRIFQTQMCFLGSTGSGQQIVENVETPLARGHGCYPAPLESVIKDLATNERGAGCGGRVVLQFEEKTSLGRGRCCDGFGCGQGVEDEGRQRELCRKWCRGKG